MHSDTFPTGRFFQLGYVTRDLDAAVAMIRDRHGVEAFHIFDTRTSGDQDPGEVARIALAYHGPVMIELIEPMRNDPGIHADALPASGIALHHMGYLVSGEQFLQLDAASAATGAPIAARLDGGTSGVTLAYVDTRTDLGHFSEFVVDNEAGRAFFADVPGRTG